MSWRPAHSVRLVTVLALFVIVAVAISTVVVSSVLNLQTRSAGTYHAVLNEASGLREGDNVKIAGLTVGRVQEVELRDDTVLLTFTVADERTVYTDTHAQVKFANLIGNRYLALSLRTGTGSPAGTGGGAAADAEGEPLDEGGTIPLSQTEPAIDLTAVFNGFQPLFDALTPDEINELSMSIIEVLQGQSGDVSHLVEQIATITQNLADRKELIGSVIKNLSEVLGKVDQQRESVADLIDNFDSIVDNLAGQRKTLAQAITAMGRFTSDAAELTQKSADAINKDIPGLAKASRTLAQNQDAISSMLRNAPEALNSLTSTMDSGSYVKVYLCNLDLKTQGKLNLSLVPGVEAPQPPRDVPLPDGKLGSGALNEVCR